MFQFLVFLSAVLCDLNKKSRVELTRKNVLAGYFSGDDQISEEENSKEKRNEFCRKECVDRISDLISFCSRSFINPFRRCTDWQEFFSLCIVNCIYYGIIFTPLFLSIIVLVLLFPSFCSPIILLVILYLGIIFQLHYPNLWSDPHF